MSLENLYTRILELFHLISGLSDNSNKAPVLYMILSIVVT